MYQRYFFQLRWNAARQRSGKRNIQNGKTGSYKGISKKVKQLLEVLKLEAYSEELPVQMDRIHVKNGTYFLSGSFTEMKEFCLNRLPVNYEMKEAKPERWLKFLSELLEEDDIPTLQEYMGYCLIPSNKAQKLLIILGKGGRENPVLVWL